MRSVSQKTSPRAVLLGAAVVLALCIGMFFGVRAVRHSLTEPGQVAEAARSGQRLREAILTYRARYGHFPLRLMDVIQDGLADGAMLHVPLDPDPRPMHLSWQYTPPENDAASTPLLRLTGISGGALVITVGGQVCIGR